MPLNLPAKSSGSELVHIGRHPVPLKVWMLLTISNQAVVERLAAETECTGNRSLGHNTSRKRFSHPTINLRSDVRTTVTSIPDPNQMVVIALLLTDQAPLLECK